MRLKCILIGSNVNYLSLLCVYLQVVGKQVEGVDQAVQPPAHRLLYPPGRPFLEHSLCLARRPYPHPSLHSCPGEFYNYIVD